MPSLVYRVEHKYDHTGMYRDGAIAFMLTFGTPTGDIHDQDTWPRMYSTDEEKKAHPMPHDDPKLWDFFDELLSWRFKPGGREEAKKWLFGFANLVQLRSWLHERAWLEYMDSRGYVCSVYECEDDFAHHGDTQAMFHCERAKIIETRSLLEC